MLSLASYVVGPLVELLTKNSLRKLTESIHCDDRHVIVKVADCLFANVYLPCAGTINRQAICEDIFADIWVWRERHKECNIVVAGDFNVCLDDCDNAARSILRFADDCSLVRCDDLFPRKKVPT